MRIVNVTTLAELQAAINKAKGGDVICVPPNFTITGAITLKNHGGGQIAIVSAIGVKGEAR